MGYNLDFSGSILVKRKARISLLGGALLWKMQKIWAGKILSHALNKLVNGLGLGMMAVAKQG